MRMYRVVATVMVLLAVLIACGGDGAEPTPTVRPAARPAPTATATTAVPPTATTEPTPSPTAAPTPTPQPDVISEPVATGHEIVFAGQFGDGQHRLYAVDLDGSNLHQVTTAEWSTYRRDLYEAFPAFSPDGNRVAFLRTGTPRGGRYIGGVYVVDVDSKAEQLVVTGWASDIGWSPDGSRLAFAWLEWDWPPYVDKAAGDNPFKLAVVNADGTDLRVLSESSVVEGVEPSMVIGPRWSPDGTRILYARWGHTADGVGEVIDPIVVNADGTGMRELDSGGIALGGPVAWTPDGTAITFVGGDPVSLDPPGLYRLPLDGSDLVRLTGTQIAVVGDFAWSPDGAEIVFTGVSDWDQVTFDFAPGAVGLYRMHADGSDMAPLVTRPQSAEVSPVWSPDGTQITFITVADDPSVTEVELRVMAADGSGASTLLAHYSQCNAPSSLPVWRPPTSSLANPPAGVGHDPTATCPG
jgi:Tol biopolymer transport system component